MKASDLIKLSELVEVEVEEDLNYGGSYLSKIEDIEDQGKDKFLNISLPIEKGRIIPLRVGQKVSVNITKKDGVYSFSGKILRRTLKPLPYFVLNYPDELKRIQRRNYVRITLNIMSSFKFEKDIKEHILDVEKIPIFKGVTVNLSGGGMNVIATKKLKLGDIIVLEFRLTNGFLCKKVKGIVKRIISIEEEQKNFKENYGLEFVEIDNKTREEIISYLFELQRDRRKKGIEI